MKFMYPKLYEFFFKGIKLISMKMQVNSESLFDAINSTEYVVGTELLFCCYSRQSRVQPPPPKGAALYAPITTQAKRN